MNLHNNMKKAWAWHPKRGHIDLKNHWHTKRYTRWLREISPLEMIDYCFRATLIPANKKFGLIKMSMSG
jgi:hypothetical protein